MTIVELCRQEAANAGFSEDVINEAEWFAAITNPGKDAKEAIQKDIPEPLLSIIRMHIQGIFQGSKNPGFIKAYQKLFDENIGNKN